MNTIFFFHGFAIHPSIWTEQIREFSGEYLIQADPDQFAGQENGFLIGWSMGGLKALKLCQQYPHKVKGVVLVSAFARYLENGDYPCGTPYVLFRKLEKKIQSNYREGIKYFYRLVCGGEKLHPVFRNLPLPEPAEVEKDLEILKNEDLRTILPTIKTPVLLIHGVKDRVVSLKSSYYLNKMIPDSKLVIFDKSGHAPFLDEAGKFNLSLRGFVKKHGA